MEADQTKKRRRPDLSEMARITAAQERQREEAIKNAPVVKTTGTGNDISYDQWWMLINKKLSLPYHLKEVIKVDFKARGAGKMETEKKYNELLRLFGYKW